MNPNQPFMAIAILAASLLPASGTESPVHPQAMRTFPNVLPGKTVVVKKVWDSRTKSVKFFSNSDYARSADQLVALERAEADAIRKKYGAVSGELRPKLARMRDGEKVLVFINSRLPEGIVYLNKTQHPESELKAQSENLLTLAPLKEAGSVLARYGYPVKATLNRGMVAAELTRDQVESLKSDPDIAKIEEVPEAGPAQGSYPPFYSFVRSAYNPNAEMPSDARGWGVKAATIELGLEPAFIACKNYSVVGPDFIPNFNSSDLVHRHSLAVFTCLGDAAPQATLFHRRSNSAIGTGWPGYVSTADHDFLINNGIQSVSISSKRQGAHAGYEEFMIMDDFAYRWPYPVFSTPTANDGYTFESNWQGYNAINVGNVRHTNEHSGINMAYEISPASNCTQTRNPPPIHGYCISGSGATCPGDREMPYLVAPGYSPDPGVAETSGPCLSATQTCGTSYSAPLVNAMAANVLSADSRLVAWPEKVRAALLVSAPNVEGGYWSSGTDGRDGTGVVSGVEAVWFARNHSTVSPNNSPAVEYGMHAGYFFPSDFSDSNPISFNIQIPSAKPAGRHLRVVLTWDSNPVLGTTNNALSDLDLTVSHTGGSGGSYSYDNNVEIVDIASANLSAGSAATIQISKWANRIPASGSRAPYFYYSVAWNWVKDSAN